MHQFSSVQSLSHVRLFASSWTVAHQAPLFSTTSRTFLKFMSIELVILCNHLFLCQPLLLPSIFPSIKVFQMQNLGGFRSQGWKVVESAGSHWKVSEHAPPPA